MDEPNDGLFELDIFGQHQRPLYIQICLCFPMADSASRPAIERTLQDGLGRLAEVFPWIAGRVIRVEEDGSSGMKLKIQLPESTSQRTMSAEHETSSNGLPQSSMLVIKDLSAEIDPMEQLRQADFPMSKHDESLLCPLGTRPEQMDGYPVFLLQANFIQGGLLLTFESQHQAMDMTGHSHVMYLLDKACRKEAFTDEEVRVGNLERRRIIPTLDDESEQLDPTLGPQLSAPNAPASTRVANTTAPKSAPPPSSQEWSHFTFPSASLAKLKSHASTPLPPNTFISTDDALSALIWQSITRARLPRLAASTQAQTTLSRNVDTRRALGLPETYAGLVVSSTTHSRSMQALSTEPLDSIASSLRAAVLSPALVHQTKQSATALYNNPNSNSTPTPPTSRDPSTSLRLSSWAKETQIHSLDFGLGLGKPESIRRPRFFPAEGIVYLLPRDGEGGVGVGVCLRGEDMEGLREEGGWRRFARGGG